MPARNSTPVRYLYDETALPRKRQEVVTRTANALAFWHGGTYDRPDHHLDALVTGSWSVIETAAPGCAEPALIYYDRAQAPRPFETHGQHYAQLGDAMEAAVLIP